MLEESLSVWELLGDEVCEECCFDNKGCSVDTFEICKSDYIVLNFDLIEDL